MDNVIHLNSVRSRVSHAIEPTAVLIQLYWKAAHPGTHTTIATQSTRFWPDSITIVENDSKIGPRWKFTGLNVCRWNLSCIGDSPPRSIHYGWGPLGAFMTASFIPTETGELWTPSPRSFNSANSNKSIQFLWTISECWYSSQGSLQNMLPCVCKCVFSRS